MQEYQTLIIGGVAIVIVAIILLLVLKSRSKKEPTIPEVKEEPKKEEPKKEQIKTTQISKPTTKEVKESQPLLIEDEPKVEEPKVEVSTKVRELPKREKREVPAHGKITKDNFKEFAGTRILVAEDNMINQKVIKGLLAESGIEIVIANDGQEAIDILAQDSNFEFILMDAHMPNVDGFEATRIIRTNPAYDHILVVALSGDTAADDIKKMQDAGMEEQLEKPLKMDALYDIFYAYTKAQPQVQQESEVVQETQVDDSKELDYQKGLETCGSDVDFYHEILREFVEKYENAADRIDDLIIDEDLKKVNELLHEILGVAANIGADKIHALTTQMKESIKATNGESYADYSEDYREKLEKLMAEIKEYL